MAMLKANIIKGIEQDSIKPIQVKRDFKYVDNFIYIALRFCHVTHRFLGYKMKKNEKV